MVILIVFLISIIIGIVTWVYERDFKDAYEGCFGSLFVLSAIAAYIYCLYKMLSNPEGVFSVSPFVLTIGIVGTVTVLILLYKILLAPMLDWIYNLYDYENALKEVQKQSEIAQQRIDQISKYYESAPFRPFCNKEKPILDVYSCNSHRLVNKITKARKRTKYSNLFYR